MKMYKNKRLYNIWKKMRCRCYSQKCRIYRYYGGRGITICSLWYNNFFAFQAWALQNGYQDNLTIDRIDPNRNYEPLNCRWITRAEQSRNTRRVKRYEVDGKIMTHNQTAMYLGISPSTLTQRIHLRGVQWAVSHKKLPHRMTAKEIKQLGNNIP